MHFLSQQRCGTSPATQEQPGCDRLEFAQSYRPQAGIKTYQNQALWKEWFDLWEFCPCNPTTVKNTIKPLVTQEEVKICWISACASGDYDSVWMKNFVITQSIWFLWNTLVVLSRLPLEVLQRRGMETWKIRTQTFRLSWLANHLLIYYSASVCVFALAYISLFIRVCLYRCAQVG